MPILFVFALMLLPIVVRADTYFSVKPQKCVALHKGQTCYQKLKFHWNSTNQNLCLFRKGEEKPLHCASNDKPVSYHYELAASEGSYFELRNASDESVATLFVDVVSVYKGKRRATTGWRIF